MGKEIERKFLVNTELWKPQRAGERICQGYLNAAKERTVRVRQKGNRGFLTVKGENQGIVRQEFEYEIPLADAKELLRLCERPLVEKTRYTEVWGGRVWEIDCFAGENEGLILAEAELARSDEAIERPAWLGMEVSADARYYNANLIAHPYSSWRKI